MMIRTLSAAVVVALAGLSACTSMMPSAAAPAMTADGVLVGPNAMTLYVFDRDTAGSGKSACNGPCIGLWPALSADAASKPVGDYTVVTRDDGKMQWAYKGKPLYFWSKDAKAGDKTGDGFNNVWHVAKP